MNWHALAYFKCSPRERQQPEAVRAALLFVSEHLCASAREGVTPTFVDVCASVCVFL